MPAPAASHHFVKGGSTDGEVILAGDGANVILGASAELDVVAGKRADIHHLGIPELSAAAR